MLIVPSVNKDNTRDITAESAVSDVYKPWFMSPNIAVNKFFSPQMLITRMHVWKCQGSEDTTCAHGASLTPEEAEC